MTNVAVRTPFAPLRKSPQINKKNKPRFGSTHKLNNFERMRMVVKK